jgi:nitrogen fixation protein NifU and related proteins
MFDDLNDLYQQVIIDHSKRPRNFRAMEGATRQAHGKNPLCGDNFTVFLKVENDVVKDVSFQGSGCAISVASASMMTEALKGKSKAEAEKMFLQFHSMITEGGKGAEELGKLGVLSGVNKFPMRVKCAILSWHAANAAIVGEAEVVSTETDEGQKIN